MKSNFWGMCGWMGTQAGLRDCLVQKERKEMSFLSQVHSHMTRQIYILNWINAEIWKQNLSPCLCDKSIVIKQN